MSFVVIDENNAGDGGVLDRGHVRQRACDPVLPILHPNKPNNIDQVGMCLLELLGRCSESEKNYRIVDVRRTLIRRHTVDFLKKFESIEAFFDPPPTMQYSLQHPIP